MDFEVTIEKLKEAKIAEQYGANRVEICCALDLGGLTPSLGLIQNCVTSLSTTESHVLIRPRPGNFTYSKEEVKIMMSDIQAVAELGVNGVVVGMLKTDNSLDFEVTKLLVEYSKSLDLEVTFHRAIDFCTSLESTVSQLVDLGVNRILTSGQKPSAIEGIETIKQLVEWSNGQIEIMAGSGVNPDNAKNLIQTGISALHFSIRKAQPNTISQMGTSYLVDEEKLKSLAELIK